MIAALIVALAGVAPGAKGPSPLEDRCVAVLGNSDLHGALRPHVAKVGETELRYGGLPAQAAYLKILRETYGDRMVLLDGGDLYQGTFESNLNHGEAVIAAYNTLGVDAAAVGNHEFDYGPLEPNDLDRVGIFKKRIEEAQFPFLTLNVFNKLTHRRVSWPGTQPSVLLDVGSRHGGLRVGIMGVSTVDTKKVTKLENVTHLEFPNPVPLIIAEARQLRARGAELVLMTAHIGSFCKSLKNPKDYSRCDQTTELFEVLKALPPGTLDVVVGGHTHHFVGHWVNGTFAMQAGSRGKALAWIEACAKSGGGIDIKRSKTHSPIDVCVDEWSDGGCNSYRKKVPGVKPATFYGQPIEPPAEMVAMLQPYYEVADREINKPIDVVLTEPLLRTSGEVQLGPLVAEAARLAADSDFAVQNIGGVRADLPVGPLRFGQVYEVLPFGNQIGVIELTGAQVLEVIELLIPRRNTAPFHAGLIIEKTDSGWTTTLADGSPVDPLGSYTLALSDFMLKGGEGLSVVFDQVGDSKKRILDATLRGALTSLLQARFPPPPPVEEGSPTDGAAEPSASDGPAADTDSSATAPTAPSATAPPAN